MDVTVIIHATDTVGSNREDQAASAMSDLGSQISDSISTRTGATLDNSKAPDKVDKSMRRDWINYVEDELHADNYLEDASVHVLLYHKTINWDTSNGGAGFAEWDAGSTNSGRLTGDRDYSSDGRYAFASVNTATGNYPYNQRIFEMTVMHEVGHTLGTGHRSGAIQGIYENGSINYHVSPMLTWYAEQPCLAFPTDNSSYDSICFNDKDKNTACNHHRALSSSGCNQDESLNDAETNIQTHIDNQSSYIK
ncbi:MAG: zinc-dependent metalloprotease family protein [Halobaculum sp.]